MFDGKVFFTDAEFSGGRVDFTRSEFCGRLAGFMKASFFGSYVAFHETVLSRGTADFTAGTFSEGSVNFHRAEFSGGRVLFHLAEFEGGEVNFGGANFYDDRVDFGMAQFTGGTVIFLGAMGSAPARLTELARSPASLPTGLVLFVLVHDRAVVASVPSAACAHGEALRPFAKQSLSLGSPTVGLVTCRVWGFLMRTGVIARLAALPTLADQ